MTAYIAYIDDSGDEQLDVYAAVLIPVEQWTRTLRIWLTFRANIYATYGVPADYELHATQFIRAGEGRPAPNVTYGINTDGAKRRRVLHMANLTLKSMNSLRVIAKVEAHSSPERCYRALVREVELRLAAEDSWALMIVDGDGSQGYQKTVHRGLKLDERRIIEDPWYQGSHLSQLVQMADIAAYSVFQGHRLRESRRALWGWMRECLHDREWPGQCSCPA